ncbi:SPOR domain-containing protein [Atopomonas sediminilitoris]|uniref:SPOR domain-containing protein n=1 Tax=Atopomonas sediminilitoris TaxID=2919919 RepID=UPI001F4E4202|nr:SPOR domain-containing protein [Atopomonas sediminilitoris]MCJ8170927.1 SPOR domain-containing protein [Atopomonas sediminilitoris]
MRWILLFLLMLNAVYFVWHQQQVPLVGKELPAVQAYRESSGSIKLLSEGGAPVVRAEQSAAANACLLFGPFERNELADDLRQRLLSLDIASLVVNKESDAGADFAVYLAPMASRSAAIRQLRELQARKIDSYLITQGPNSNGLSLGIFPRRESADAIAARLRQAGYAPLIEEITRAQRQFWVEVQPEGRRLLDDGLLAGLKGDFPAMRHQFMSCATQTD